MNNKKEIKILKNRRDVIEISEDNISVYYLPKLDGWGLNNGNQEVNDFIFYTQDLNTLIQILQTLKKELNG